MRILRSAELESLRLTSAWAENNKYVVVDIRMAAPAESEAV